MTAGSPLPISSMFRLQEQPSSVFYERKFVHREPQCDDGSIVATNPHQHELFAT